MLWMENILSYFLNLPSQQSPAAADTWILLLSSLSLSSAFFAWGRRGSCTFPVMRTLDDLSAAFYLCQASDAAITDDAVTSILVLMNYFFTTTSKSWVLGSLQNKKSYQISEKPGLTRDKIMENKRHVSKLICDNFEQFLKIDIFC